MLKICQGTVDTQQPGCSCLVLKGMSKEIEDFFFSEHTLVNVTPSMASKIVPDDLQY
jgi:hypothetical protein